MTNTIMLQLRNNRANISIMCVEMAVKFVASTAVQIITLIFIAVDHAIIKYGLFY